MNDLSKELKALEMRAAAIKKSMAHQARNLDELAKKQKKGWIDIILEKAISRKLLVFATATGLLSYSLLDPETWGMIAIVYVGGQAVIDAVKVYRHGG